MVRSAVTGSFTDTVKAKVPAWVGVPEITPPRTAGVRPAVRHRDRPVITAVGGSGGDQRLGNVGADRAARELAVVTSSDGVGRVAGVV
jgi:hypothetical protein